MRESNAERNTDIEKQDENTCKADGEDSVLHDNEGENDGQDEGGDDDDDEEEEKDKDKDKDEDG